MHSSKFSFRSALSLLAIGLLAGSATGQVIVTEFAERPADPAELVAGTWYDWFTTFTAEASVVTLAGLGGDLELDAPLPSGAALLTTEFDNSDRANVGVFDLLGTPGDVFPTLQLDYAFLKGSNPGQNNNAAAALKLEIFNDTCDDPASGGDCYGVLVYEPYVNGFGNFPTQDVWLQASITPDSGGFWWTGGFGQPNTGGGPPYRTLGEWLGLMSSDFLDATIVTVQVGVGSYNQGQRAYFDAVAIRHDGGAGLDVVYDFQLSSPIEIDLRPNNAQNQVNTNAKQLVPIALLGSATFDPVADVDPETVLVRGAAPLSTKVDTDDVNADGFDDLTLYFRARSLRKPTEAECTDGNAKLELTGVTFFSQPFAGVDDVSWQGPDCNF